MLASSAPAGVLLLDAGGGDLPAVLGLPEPPAPGLAQWCEAGDEVPPGALGRLELDAAPGLRLVPYGIPERVPPTAADGHRLAVTLALADDPRPAVVDCGSTESPFATALAGAATTSLLVLRPCYLALRRAVAAPVRPSGVVLVEEPGRSLDGADVEAALGVPVRATIPWHQGVARAVDAGLLTRGLPRALARPLRAVA
ncbi:MAG TPA: hypothetical protein VFA94_10455 [Acidimicrobiales bacterium]|nr:hypothetical protein [Acidimicrobiales bacterium]